MIQAKTPSQSLVTMTEMIMPNDTNTLNNLMGGRLMYFMDVVAAISAQRHSDRVVVTASVDNVSFGKPIGLGSVITLTAKVTRAFNSSMEVYITVEAENIPKGEKFISNEAFLTFVAVDQSGKPIEVPKIEPETSEEKEMYKGALRRRQLRLVLAGKLSPEEATELKSIFDTK